jgi:hypothetical protein
VPPSAKTPSSGAARSCWVIGVAIIPGGDGIYPDVGAGPLGLDALAALAAPMPEADPLTAYVLTELRRRSGKRRGG